MNNEKMTNHTEIYDSCIFLNRISCQFYSLDAVELSSMLIEVDLTESKNARRQNLLLGSRILAEKDS
ncbi:hypothetical protein DY000_02020531 [Brassica cretica]|uniref:Uncharacterized protein n=1 Tax=Brassica cretica TaxID=69181 RepID=A0ABQ7E9Q6_BRACR|nr:hypothetical protein DY000_02020531 [Brassica cretica]